MALISLVIPCYNEEEAIPLLYPELVAISEQMNYVEFEFIMVDNCSEDRTLELMRELHEKDSRVRYISFSRNFGKEASMYAGLKASKGDYAAIMDADLQDPPTLLPQMYEAVTKEGYDCAATYRKDRKGEPWFRSVMANVFYAMIGKISSANMKSGARDFRLMRRSMVDAVLSLEENERFSKGIFGWVGFKTKWISFENVERSAGKTKLPFWSAFTYALKGIIAFSTVPLAISSLTGVLCCIAAAVYAIYVIIKQIISAEAVSGYPSLVCLILFIGGVQLLMIGVLGQYMSQIYLEIKNRPKYIIRETDQKVEGKKN
ncbi:MAG TPA: glycosyltransferase family 2 protein [Lachnospiraceae bacterium]|nr:glycosyltransferase family 2 protein [Lachnospiraceae bacterium]